MCPRHLIAFAFSLFCSSAVSGQGIIVDNGGLSGFSVLSGTWTANTSGSGYYAADYLLCQTVSAGANRSEVEWRPTLATTGDYEVFIRHVAGSNRASDARVMIHHAAGETMAVVNQQVNGGQWVSLGVFPFQAGTSGCVRLTNAAGGSYVVADAVKFVNPSLIQSIAPDDARVRLEGSFFSAPGRPGLMLRRFTEEMLMASTDTYLADRAATTSGIGIRIRTDSPWVRATFVQTPGFWMNSQLLAFEDRTFITIGGPLVVEAASSRPGQPVTYRVVCPPYETLAFTGFEVQTGSSIYVLPPDGRPRYAAFGDSITHGSGMTRSNQTYPWMLAEAKGWEVFNFAISASKVTPSFGAMLDGEPLDVVTVLWGQNDLGLGVTDFTSRYEQFLTNLRQFHPKTAIYCITLTATTNTETSLRASFRQAVRDIVATRAAAGDAHIHVLEGLELSTTADLSDAVHLSASGNVNVAARLGAAIRYPGGSGVFLDFDRDADVDVADFAAFDDCTSGPAIPLRPGCEDKDFDRDGDVDPSDFGVFQRCLTVPGGPVVRDCVD